MALYKSGETKTRPGVYRRYSNRGTGAAAGASYGVCAVALCAEWGPAGVTTHENYQGVIDTYMTGGTVDAAKYLFDGGATKVFVVRANAEGGTPATLNLSDADNTVMVVLNTLYSTGLDFEVTVRGKLSDPLTKELLLIHGTDILEKIEFAASCNGKQFAEVVNGTSKYLSCTVQAGETGTISDMVQTPMTGGTTPLVTSENYSKALNLLEPFGWNVVVTDTQTAEVNALVASYITRVKSTGKSGVAVVGEPTTVSLSERFNHAKAFNDECVIYAGSGFMDGTGATIQNYRNVCLQAGIIASTSADTSITHKAIPGAVSVLENLTNSQYEDAIKSGCLMLSTAPSGSVWFDAGINTLVTLSAEQDEGWKKIRRTATRYEVFDRIDKTVSPIVGKVNCDSDGVAQVIQLAQKVLNTMVAEKKLMEGASIYEDPANPHAGDSAWFIIAMDDVDSLEKIYLHYQLRYSANS